MRQTSDKISRRPSNKTNNQNNNFSKTKNTTSKTEKNSTYNTKAQKSNSSITKEHKKSISHTPVSKSINPTNRRRSKVQNIRTIDLFDPNEPIRLNKLMAAKGICSRREADFLISKGWVRINGKTALEIGCKALPSDTIELDAQAKNTLNKQVTILYHKPIGIVSGQPEGHYKAALECLSLENQADRKTNTPFQPSMLKGLAPAGRLDIDSTGLLILTQDGRIAKQLIDANSSIEKEYLVRVEGQLHEKGLQQLRHGLILDGTPLKPAKVSWQNEDQLRFVLIEGKKRQIRRMCEMVGLKVTGLKRVRIGKVMLGDLPVGQWRLLQPQEYF